jgi:hypothetical protein
MTASYKTTLPQSFSLFVINAKEIITAPPLCDSDGICEPPTENEATCPTDCIPTAEEKCKEGETLCIGDSLYRCVSREFLKTETCKFGCSDGACLEEEPPLSFQNTLYMIIMSALIILAMGVAIIFLRKS